MERQAIEILRPVRYGILVGFLGLLFGIGWALWLVLGHERIHKSLEAMAGTNAPIAVSDRAAKKEEPEAPKAKVHIHRDGKAHPHGPAESPGMPQSRSQFNDDEARQGMKQSHAHDDPVMELAHSRLVRGHLHAMGLGLVTIVISIVIAFTTAGRTVKTAVPVLAGLGGLIYPLAWIVMGYSTPALGPEGAEAYVTMIAGPGVALVLVGILTAAGYLSKDIFSGR